jgi:hypothetical protein
LQGFDEGLGGKSAVDFEELAFLELEGIGQEQIGEPIKPFITHTGSSLCTLRFIL